jgi:hypothetical protein
VGALGEFVPPLFMSPHVLIDPSALRAAKAWGGSNDGGTDAPSGKGYTKIYSTWRSFAALKADGSITAWGYTDAGGTDAPNAPTDKGYIKIIAFVSGCVLTSKIWVTPRLD